MTPAPATRLGPYEIVAPLGAGGMGEVYRARDTRLDRDVAVKVLSEFLAADPDTLARFEREAKAVAALSHPNIVHGGVRFTSETDSLNVPLAFGMSLHGQRLRGDALRDRLAGITDAVAHERP